jgi:hypothetical protein
VFYLLFLLRLVSCVWWSPLHIALCFIFCFSYVLFLVYGGVHHILLCVLSFVSLTSCFLCMVESITYCFVFYLLFLLRLVSCVWWSPSHIDLCFIFCFSYVLFLVYIRLSVSQYCPFVIVPLVSLTFIQYEIVPKRMNNELTLCC